MKLPISVRAAARDGFTSLGCLLLLFNGSLALLASAYGFGEGWKAWAMPITRIINAHSRLRDYQRAAGWDGYPRHETPDVLTALRSLAAPPSFSSTLAGPGRVCGCGKSGA